ncbi:hypothetical protein L249_6730 [Ophiocordyceps polyrhachis-furcata BCC 54312]|uniref:Basic proline-rich protein n=1 Tax=Ophiocordyceps polyrhachis-furcata BCC 54312 TaxID=1330021 RepID=A0A367LLM9_9HYPO|nr:hypothetical protein L249_6730 [Ophiocordyceps polyrhachis-furcata BCC 54312]
MEPVPETERMEEFKPSLVPASRLSASSSSSSSSGFDLDTAAGKPPPQRRSTDPSPSTIPFRPRTASPLAASHSNPRTSALPMSRAQSMPGLGASGRGLCSPQLRPASPSGSPSRVRPLRRPVDDVFPLSSPVRASVLDSEPRCASPGSMNRRHRPSSPLHGGVAVPSSGAGGIPGSPSLSTLPSTPTSGFPLRSYDASGYMSSVPSTPTSARSRSPSISSLETIPDSPDAEEAAVEAERLARLKADAEAVDGKARSAADVPSRGRTMSFGPRDKRKRWSVCGAERRGDLDLETIWED